MVDWRKHEMDERTQAVEHRAGYLAYQVLGYLLLLDMMIRALRPAWVDWNGFPVDIPVMALIAGIVDWSVKSAHRTVGPRRLRMMSAGILLAMTLAVAVGFLMQKALS